MQENKILEQKVIENKEPQEAKKDENPENVSIHRSGRGFNLIAPQLEKAEKESSKKFTVDIRVVLFVFFVVLISLGVIGYNWYISMILNNERVVLANLEENLEGYKYTIEANNQVLERYTFYENVQEGFISSKEVLTFWQEVSDNLAEIRSIELSNGVNFEVSGKASSLRDVTKLWHFLSIDDRLSSVTLEGFSIPVESSSDSAELNFSFKGVLNLQYFTNKK